MYDQQWAEGLFAEHNDILLPLDEMTAAKQEQIAAIIYQFANGQGKSRAKKDGSSAASSRWRCMLLSSGEHTLAQQIEKSGGKIQMTGGLAVRIVDIPIEVSPGESFESCAPFKSSGEFVKQLFELSLSNYGYAGPQFVRYLVDNSNIALDRAKALLVELREELIDPGDDPQLERVADRFALVAVAGLLAVEAGVLSMRPDSIVNAARKCFLAWKEQRGGNLSEEELRAQQHLKRFFDANGSSRFERLKRNTKDTEDTEDLSAERSIDFAIRDRCGYRVEADDGANIYYILPEAWKKEVCGHHSPQLMAKIAKKAGALELGEGNHFQKKIRLPDYPKGIRVYALRPDKLH